MKPTEWAPGSQRTFLKGAKIRSKGKLVSINE